MHSTGFCSSGFPPWKQAAFIPAHAWCSSRSCSHLHSSSKPTCNTCMDITLSSPRISPWQFFTLQFLHQPQWHAQLLHFYPSGSIISDWASFMIGLLDAQLLISTYGANYPSWSASVIWHPSLCFCYKPCLLDTILMQHHATSLYISFLEIVLMRLTHCVNHTDQVRLYQSEIRVIDHCKGYCSRAEHGTSRGSKEERIRIHLQVWANIQNCGYKE